MLPLSRLDYVRPKSLEEAIHILAQAQKGSMVLAGGTDLIVQMKKGLVRPRLLVDIKSIPRLSRISLTGKRDLVLGAGVTLAELHEWARTKREWFGLSIATGSIGSEQVRNRGTVVGNVCRASPAGDMAPMLIAMDGEVEITGPKGRRFVLVEDFIVGPHQTILARGEMATALKVPKPPSSTSAMYLKHGTRRAMDIAVVAVAVRITHKKASRQTVCARIVLGAVGPIPTRVPEAEAILLKNGVTSEILEEVSTLAVARAEPITDLRGTERYRSEMVRVLTKRAVEQAWRQSREGAVAQ